MDEKAKQVALFFRSYVETWRASYLLGRALFQTSERTATSNFSQIGLANSSRDLVCLGQFDAGVIVLDDLVVFDAHFCQAVRSVLAHPDAVAPATASEGIAGDG